MKKFLLFFVLVMLVASLAACDGRPSQQQLFDSCWGRTEWPTDPATLSGCELYVARQNAIVAKTQMAEQAAALATAEKIWDEYHPNTWGKVQGEVTTPTPQGVWLTPNP